MGIFHLEKGQEVQEKSGVLQKAKIRNKQSNLFIRVFKQIANRIDLPEVIKLAISLYSIKKEIYSCFSMKEKLAISQPKVYQMKNFICQRASIPLYLEGNRYQ